MLPTKFWELAKEEQAVMIAWCEANNEMATYSEQIAENAPRPKPTKG